MSDRASILYPSKGNTATGERRLLSINRIRRRWERSQLEIVLVALTAVSFACLLAYASDMLREPWKGLAISIGSATLGGGVFAFLTKLSQISGVIREELEAIVFSRDT